MTERADSLPPRLRWTPLLRAPGCRIDVHLLDGEPYNAHVNGAFTSVAAAYAIAAPIMAATPERWWKP